MKKAGTKNEQVDYAPVMERIERLMLSLSDPIIPMDTIESLLTERGIALESKAYERLRRAHRRNVAKGTASPHQVDEMCVLVLRRHPAELYGIDWYEPKKEEDVAPEGIAA